MNCNTTHYRANSSSVPGDPTYRAYIAALEAGDEKAAQPYVFEHWQLTATLVDGESILSARRNGDRVVLVLGGTFPGVTNRNGSKARTVGTARMLYEDGRWKVRSRRWDINPVANPVSEAMAWLVSNQR